MTILTLPADVVNQIAAGEVVERPANLIKELIENSLDAKADQIEVHLNSGNLDLIVKDNGIGMTKEDLQASIRAHSTSKLHEFSDLQKLSTYGFRGEALASISSVCDLQIISKYKKTDTAYALNSKFGNDVQIEAANLDAGTEIHIKDLFVNVPARLKFLKSIGAEQSQILNALKSFALLHNQVEFKIYKNKELVYFWPKTAEWVSRIEAVLECTPFIETSLESSGIKVRMAFLPPSQVFKTSKNIWLFAQKRWIQDKSLQFAVMDGYRSTLMTKEFPAVVVDIICEPDLIDVNVHPSKSQVRFSTSLDPFRLVRNCISQAVKIHPNDKSKSQMTSSSESMLSHLPNYADKPHLVREPIKQSFDNLVSTTQYKKSVTLEDFQKAAYQQQESNFLSASDNDMSLNVTSTEAPLSEQTVNSSWSGLDVIGQAQLTYLVCQNESELILVDQHAAHERVLYDKLIKGWKSCDIDIQSFLFPLSFDLNEEAVEKFLTFQNDILKLGFEVEQGGPQTILVRAAPSGINDSSIIKALQQMATELSESGYTSSFEELVTHACATMACHSAVRAGQAMSSDQIKSLLVAMDQVELSDYCPHGRPVSIEFSRASLEKKFGRIN